MKSAKNITPILTALALWTMMRIQDVSGKRQIGTWTVVIYGPLPLPLMLVLLLNLDVALEMHHTPPKHASRLMMKLCAVGTVCVTGLVVQMPTANMMTKSHRWTLGAVWLHRTRMQMECGSIRVWITGMSRTVSHRWDLRDIIDANGSRRH